VYGILSAADRSPPAARVPGGHGDGDRQAAFQPGGGLCLAAVGAGDGLDDGQAQAAAAGGADAVGEPAEGLERDGDAQSNGETVGHGAHVRRYKVEVENGIDVPAEQAADEISGILADPRGWTDNGVDSFRLVSSGPYDFVVKIATPGTVDAICGAAGADTGGQLDCDVGEQVMVNLRRWVWALPSSTVRSRTTGR
jgi:hypothetical protein